MKRIIVASILATAFSLQATTPPHGSEQLRELVVFPVINLTFTYGLNSRGDEWVINKSEDLPGQISRVRAELKKQPDDVQQLMLLSFLLNSDDQTNESKACFQKVEKLCRSKAAVKPQDGLNLIDLGEALWELDKDEEAESVYRKATMVSSNDWRCWVRLGNFLSGYKFSSLFPEKMLDKLPGMGQMPPPEILDYHPSPEALEKSETALAEASRCFDRAMALAPQEGEVFFQRAGFLSVSNYQACLYRHFRDKEQIDPNSLVKAFFSDQTIASLKKASELNPQNCDYIAIAAGLERLSAASRADPKNFSPENLPDATRQSIHDAMTRLEILSQSSNKQTAAQALETLGFLNFSFENMEAARANFRQAVSLDPTSEQSWDMSLLLLKESATPEEKVALCESRLKHKDSARNHLLLARAFQYQKKWDKAKDETFAALKLEPDNVIAQIELAALALKQSANPVFMAIADKQLELAAEAFKKMPDSKEKVSRWRELELNRAIFNGLVDSPEFKSAARTCLKDVLDVYPDDEDAKAISSALD